MDNRSTIEDLIERSRQMVDNDPEHKLGPFYRCLIYSMLGPADAAATRLKRGTLAIRAVEKVMPVWDQELPDNAWPDELISRAKDVLAGSISPDAGYEEAEATIDKAAEWYSELYEGDVPKVSLTAQGVLLAAIGALFEASGAYRLTLEYANPDDTEADLDYTTTDAASYAAYSYAGFWYEDNSDPKKLHEFWDWWLTEALAIANLKP